MNITHVRPRFGPPVVVTLDYPNAKEVTSQLHGNTEYMFTCNDGSVKFYAPVEAYEQIAKLNPAAGATISVRKLKKGTHNVFEAALVSDAQEPEPEPEPPKPVAKPRVTPPRQGVSYDGNGAKFPPALYHQAVPNGHTNGATHPYVERYARMFVVAAHALSLAHAQLVQEGMDLEPFNWEDIRATAIHFAIGFERREERNHDRE